MDKENHFFVIFFYGLQVQWKNSLWNCTNMENLEIPYKTKLFTVKKSTIPNSGVGLFANKKFLKGESLGPYGGKLLTEVECNKEKYAPYLGHMVDLTNIENAKPFVAIHPPPKMVLRYINHSPKMINGKKITGKKSTNVRFSTMDKKPFIEMICTRDIEVGDEIFLNYGRGFTQMFLSMNKDLLKFYST
jgi:hypothetical protein